MGKVVFENVYKTYPPREKGGDPTTVLRRIDLTVEDGEFLVLVGPSGCGKSTLLRSIAGLEDITGGSIFVGERRVNELPPKARNIAMVFQSYALYPHLSVYDNLAFGLRRMPTTSTAQIGTEKPGEASPSAPSPGQNILDRTLVGLTRRLPQGMRYVSEQEKSVAAAVKRVAKLLQIEPLLHRLPKELSGGQKQRVALGRAIIRNPAAFLMDEPLSNLDAKLRTETRGQIVELQRQLKTTTIYVTHDQVEAMTMGDRIAVMQAGQIQQIATPLELYRQPATRFVAEFIGSPPMNFMPVWVKGATLLTNGEFRLTLPELWTEPLKHYQGRSLLLGVRPEHWIDALPAPKNLLMQVQRLEALGHETYLTVEPVDTSVAMDAACEPPISRTMQVRVTGDRDFKIGDQLWLGINLDNCHLFDATTGQAIRP
ncbi:MAG: ATP-binding cassette domain-containing protein [Cyanobacteria bacterium P01_C01_bin.89]